MWSYFGGLVIKVVLDNAVAVVKFWKQKIWTGEEKEYQPKGKRYHVLVI